MGLRGRVAHFIVAIAYQKGVVLGEQYEGIIKGNVLRFHKTHIQETFSRCSVPKGKRFLQDDVLYKTVKRQDKIWI